jgi:hypothetical protein
MSDGIFAIRIQARDSNDQILFLSKPAVRQVKEELANRMGFLKNEYKEITFLGDDLKAINDDIRKVSSGSVLQFRPVPTYLLITFRIKEYGDQCSFYFCPDAYVRTLYQFLARYYFFCKQDLFTVHSPSMSDLNPKTKIAHCHLSELVFNVHFKQPMFRLDFNFWSPGLDTPDPFRLWFLHTDHVQKAAEAFASLLSKYDSHVTFPDSLIIIKDGQDLLVPDDFLFVEYESGRRKFDVHAADRTIYFRFNGSAKTRWEDKSIMAGGFMDYLRSEDRIPPDKSIILHFRGQVQPRGQSLSHLESSPNEPIEVCIPDDYHFVLSPSGEEFELPFSDDLTVRDAMKELSRFSGKGITELQGYYKLLSLDVL